MTAPTNSDSPKEHRRIKRRPVKKGTAVGCRKGTLGLGADIAIRIHDISEEGVRLLLKTQLAKGDEIEVTLTAPGVSRALVVVALVIWTTPAGEGPGIWTGAKFRNALRYTDIFHFV